MLYSHKSLTTRLETKADQQKYGDVVLDFTYFKAPDGFNKKIEDSPVSIHTVLSHNLKSCHLLQSFQSVTDIV